MKSIYVIFAIQNYMCFAQSSHNCEIGKKFCKLQVARIIISKSYKESYKFIN